MQSKAGRKMVPRPNEVFLCAETDENDLETIECKCWIIGISGKDSQIPVGGTSAESDTMVEPAVGFGAIGEPNAEIFEVDKITTQLGTKYFEYGERLVNQASDNDKIQGAKGVSLLEYATRTISPSYSALHTVSFYLPLP